MKQAAARGSLAAHCRSPWSPYGLHVFKLQCTALMLGLLPLSLLRAGGRGQGGGARGPARHREPACMSCRAACCSQPASCPHSPCTTDLPCMPACPLRHLPPASMLTPPLASPSPRPSSPSPAAQAAGAFRGAQIGRLLAARRPVRGGGGGGRRGRHAQRRRGRQARGAGRRAHQVSGRGRGVGGEVDRRSMRTAAEISAGLRCGRCTSAAGPPSASPTQHPCPLPCPLPCPPGSAASCGTPPARSAGGMTPLSRWSGGRSPRGTCARWAAAGAVFVCGCVVCVHGRQLQVLCVLQEC